MIVAGGSFVLAWLALELCGAIHPWLAWGVEIVLIATTIAIKAREAGLEVYGHLRSGNIAEARRSLSMVVGRDTGHLDEPEIVRERWRRLRRISWMRSSLRCFALIGERRWRWLTGP